MKAELSRISGQTAQANEEYTAAIQAATNYKCINQAALANELAGLHYLKQPTGAETAQELLREAERTYLQWGQ